MNWVVVVMMHGNNISVFYFTGPPSHDSLEPQKATSFLPSEYLNAFAKEIEAIQREYSASIYLPTYIHVLVLCSYTPPPPFNKLYLFLLKPPLLKKKNKSAWGCKAPAKVKIKPLHLFYSGYYSLISPFSYTFQSNFCTSDPPESL